MCVIWHLANPTIIIHSLCEDGTWPIPGAQTISLQQYRWEHAHHRGLTLTEEADLALFFFESNALLLSVPV